MNYIFKVAPEDWLKLKENSKDIPISRRLGIWVKYFVDNEFADIYDFLEVTPGFAKLDFTGIKYITYRIEIDPELWVKFKDGCRDRDFSANYVINKLIQEYNKRGGLIPWRV